MKQLLLLFGLTVFPLVAGAFGTKDFWIPQTRTLKERAFALDFRGTVPVNRSPSSGPSRQVDAGVQMGFLEQEYVALEAGLDWHEPSPEELTSVFRGNIKVRALSLDDFGFAVALGVENFGFRTGQSDYNLLYLLFQNRITENWDMELGAFAGNSRLYVDERGGDQSKGMMFGLWRQMEGGARAGWEWVSGRSEFGYGMLGISVPMKSEVTSFIAFGVPNNRESQRELITFRLRMYY